MPDWAEQAHPDWMVLRGMADSLNDGHTSFLTPDEARRRNETSFAGIGVLMSRPQDDQPPLIAEIFPNSPAAAAASSAATASSAVDGNDVDRQIRRRHRPVDPRPARHGRPGARQVGSVLSAAARVHDAARAWSRSSRSSVARCPTRRSATCDPQLQRRHVVAAGAWHPRPGPPARAARLGRRPARQPGRLAARGARRRPPGSSIRATRSRLPGRPPAPPDAARNAAGEPDQRHGRWWSWSTTTAPRAPRSSPPRSRKPRSARWSAARRPATSA